MLSRVEPLPPIQTLKDFVGRFEGLGHQAAQADKARLIPFFQAFRQKEQELATVIHQEAPHYNLFQILRIRHYEARVHTPFLAHLLDPTESHAQGRLFYNAFFATVLGIPESEQHTSIQILPEKRNAWGQPDLQIRYQVTGRRQTVVIENKIYHHDGEAQLYQYYQFLQSCGYRNEDLLLIYLTLDGKEPSTQSLGAAPKDRLRLVSYYEDISGWLQKVQNCVPRNPVYHMLSQYLKTIQSL